MKFQKLILATVPALALSACAAGPERVSFLPPNADAASGPFISAEAGVVTPTTLPDDWWRLYSDPVLDGLVADALAANTDIRQAAARIDRARAVLRGARSEQLPDAQFSASAGYGRTLEAQPVSGADRTSGSFSLGADVSYELDLFGRVSQGIEAARGDVAAAQSDADAVRVMVVADTTLAYANAASAAARLGVARSIVGLLFGALLPNRRTTHHRQGPRRCR